MVNSYQLCWILGHNKRREPWQQLILHRALSSCLFPYWPDTVHDSKKHAESKTLKAQDTLVLYVDTEDKYLRPLNNVTLFAEGISLHSITDICYVTRFPRVGNLGAVIWVAETQSLRRLWSSWWPESLSCPISNVAHLHDYWQRPRSGHVMWQPVSPESVCVCVWRGGRQREKSWSPWEINSFIA